MPPFRVVVSFTCRESHLHLLQDTLESLYAQSLRPDAIYLNVPRSSVVPFNDSRLTINWAERDYGPLTKLLPTVMVEHDPSTLIITVDDDKIYPPELVRTLAWHSYVSNGSVALSACGWSFVKTVLPPGLLTVYVPYFMRGSGGTSVDILQGVCGNAFRRGMFILEMLHEIPRECFTVDDIWISGCLAARGIPREVIAQRLDPVNTPWKRYQTESLRQFNHEHDIHRTCVDVFSVW